MIILETIAAAFSMFSAIRMPQFSWNEKNMRYSMCAFPLVGLVTGLAWWGIFAAGRYLHLPPFLMGVLFTLLPVWITGGIHLDGYVDTCDALASHADPGRCREILKDPHIGAFGAIRLCGYFLLMAALWTCLPDPKPLPVLLGFCLSRTLSGLAVVTFPKMGREGTVSSFAEVSDKKNVRRFLAVLDLLLFAAMTLCGIEGVTMYAAAHLVFGYYYYMSRKYFGGISGDLAGWFLIQAEKWMLAALAVIQFLEGKL